MVLSSLMLFYYLHTVRETPLYQRKMLTGIGDYGDVMLSSLEKYVSQRIHSEREKFLAPVELQIERFNYNKPYYPTHYMHNPEIYRYITLFWGDNLSHISKELRDICLCCGASFFKGYKLDGCIGTHKHHAIQVPYIQ